MFHVLPAEILLKILSHLDYSDLVSCSAVCVSLRNTCDADVLWRTQCQKYWLLDLNNQESPCKEEFIKFYKEFGPYIHCYSKIKNAWDKILAYVEKNCASIYSSIRDGATEEQIKRAEFKFGFDFPKDFRCSLRIHNGQNFLSGSSVTGKGLFGTMAIHNHIKSETILDIGFATPSQLLLPGCIPLTLCLESGVTQHLALKDITGISAGTIFYPSDIIETNRGKSTYNAFISGINYTEWLTTFSRQLHNNDFITKDAQIYRFQDACERSLTTEGITVSARTCFIPELSSIDNATFFHTYQITLTMAKDVPASFACQLETRHWVIIDENGREETVNGLGVVGCFPIIRPGSNYSWVSCTSFRTTYGCMKGHFTMRNLATGLKVDIVCPAFHMKSLPYITSSAQNPIPPKTNYGSAGNS